VARESGWVVVFNRIPQVVASVEAASRARVKSHADTILADAKRRIHRLTGDLQDTAYTESTESGKSADIVFPSDHAAPVEYGTWKMSPRPFLGPAIAANQDAFFKEVFTEDAFRV
jgi:HK97 gp10 family phage protein